jgi:hypothetical protein
MTAYGPGGGYVEERVGVLVAGGLVLGEEASDLVAFYFQVQCQALVVLSRQMHLCACFIHSNLTF